MLKIITYKPCGEKAVLIEWQPIINEAILNDILSFKNKISGNSSVLFTDLIVGYNSLTIKYIDKIVNFEEEVNRLKAIYLSNSKTTRQTNYIWEIPVCYDLEFGIDLEEMSQKLNLKISDIIKLHSQKLYRVYFTGFLPGFLYLGGLDEQIYFDRKPNPRLKVVKGAVAIGGKQTGVYPQESAGGWNIIGNSPINFFNIKSKKPCFAKAGDFIQFLAVSKDKFIQIEKEISQNKYTITKTLADD